MSRVAVRAEFETRFTVERMARAYVSAYRLLLARASVPSEFATSALPGLGSGWRTGSRSRFTAPIRLAERRQGKSVTRPLDRRSRGSDLSAPMCPAASGLRSNSDLELDPEMLQTFGQDHAIETVNDFDLKRSGANACEDPRRRREGYCWAHACCGRMWLRDAPKAHHNTITKSAACFDAPRLSEARISTTILSRTPSQAFSW